MSMQLLRLRAFALAAGISALVFSGWANADPPSRVARLGYAAGEVSFSPAGENDWVQTSINRPLTSGDRLWAAAGSRAEIQLGGAMIRMDANTGASVLNLDDRIAQLQLTQGILNVRVRRLEPNQVFEVDTPNLAFTLRQPGEFRIEVDPDGSATTIIVRKGQGEVYGEGAAYVVDSRQPYRFTGTGLREYQYVTAPRLDEFDRWANERDRAFDSSGSARYVSQDVVGYQDLDANGAWRVEPNYGNVWIPNRVATDWVPYRDGHWAWIDPWGWTWVDDAPWGFAVSHYGRWTNLRGTWAWVPGPMRTPAYYAPALVTFIGGSNFQLTISSGSVGGVAWFPLAPREVYRPSYPVSRGYFENVNRSNTVINKTVINNTYNTYNTTNVTNVVYANRKVPGAVIAVPTTVFVQSQPVSRAAVRVTRETAASAPVAAIPHVAPTERSVHGAADPGGKPPARVFERPVVAHAAPPAAHVGFAAQQPLLAAKPGQPLDAAERKALKPGAVAPAAMVKVVTPAQAAPPTTRPPLVLAGAKPGDVRAKPETEKAAAAPAMSAVSPPAPPPAAAPLPTVPRQATPPMPAAPSMDARAKLDERGNGDRRARPIPAPTPVPPPRAVEPRAVMPQLAASAPALHAPQQRPLPPKLAAPLPPAPLVPSAPPAVPSQAARPEPTMQRAPKSDPTAAPRPAGPAVPVAAPQPPRPAPRVAVPITPPPAAQAVPKPEAAPAAARPVEPRPPVAASKPPPPPSQAQAAPKAEPHVQKPRAAASYPVDARSDTEEPKREDENRRSRR